jgi:hypothetical protein
MECARKLNIDPAIVDRIYILGKGVINPADSRYAADTDARKVGLFYYYSNLLQFALRESNRRKEVPYVYYFGRMSEGWKRIQPFIAADCLRQPLNSNVGQLPSQLVACRRVPIHTRR